MPNDFTRRQVIALGAAGLAAGTVTLAFPQGGWALTVDESRALIDKVVGEVNNVINSGASESRMLQQFEGIFSRYADVPTIAKSVLGPAGRQASAGQISAFTKAFQGYMSRKYGRRFREFIGGKIEVTNARPIKSYYEVISTAYLQGSAPFDVRWQVSDRSGRLLFFNIIIEGVNLLSTERTEIGAILDQQGGSIDKLIAVLNKT
ncbi:MAG: ABC transporter [Cereibacter sphaeroides]|uniref:ABC transporter n=1 Tax=Cereibacter sphaeroides TaxID=1063 RepID=A0A2W5S4C6_CERSP|nr:MAG: ABC transporter [Cereibacter sphaeroides]